MKIWVGQKGYLGFFCKKTPNGVFGQPILNTVSGISSPPALPPPKKVRRCQNGMILNYQEILS